VWEKICQKPVLKLILQIIAGLVLLVVIILIRQQLLAIFVPFAISLIIAYILNPVVIWLQQRKIPRTLSVALIYLVFFGLLFILIAQFVPMVVAELSRLAERIPRYIERAQELLANFNQATDRMSLPKSVQQALEGSLNNLEQSLVRSLGRIPEMTIDFARSIFNIILVLILTFYLLKDFRLVKDSLHAMVPRPSRTRVRKILYEIDHSLGQYIRGQLLVSLIVGFSTYLGLLFLRVDFALILAILAAITNVIPYFGPFIGAVPAVLVALLKSPALAIKTAIVITIIQQVEGQIIAPQVLGKSMGLNPLVVIMALLLGGQLFGILGMIVAVPVVAAGRILIRNLVVPPVDGG